MGKAGKNPRSMDVNYRFPAFTVCWLPEQSVLP